MVEIGWYKYTAYVLSLEDLRSGVVTDQVHYFGLCESLMHLLDLSDKFGLDGFCRPFLRPHFRFGSLEPCNEYVEFLVSGVRLLWRLVYVNIKLVQELEADIFHKLRNVLVV